VLRGDALYKCTFTLLLLYYIHILIKSGFHAIKHLLSLNAIMYQRYVTDVLSNSLNCSDCVDNQRTAVADSGGGQGGGRPPPIDHSNFCIKSKIGPTVILRR